MRILLIICFSLLLLNSYADVGQINKEHVTLQLKWFTSFQFAGYYMALEKGYYDEANLQVNIVERDPKQNNIEQVVRGEANYGIAESTLLLYRAQGYPVNILASIFQHSALIFLAQKKSGIVSPFEMRGKIISYQKGLDDASLLAMLLDAKINHNDYTYAPLDFSNMALVRGEVDVMSGYLSDQPFFMKEHGVDVNIINPLSYGIDLYGDNLFTTESELKEHPERAKRFVTASIRGWRYALENKEETIKILHEKYAAKSSIEHLRYEAEITDKMILPGIIDIGYTSVDRFVRIGEIYHRTNKANGADIKKALDGLIWDPDADNNQQTGMK